MRPTSVVLWTFLAVICMGRGHQPMELAKQAPEAPADSNKLALVASANEEFACDLYRRLAAHAGSEGQNLLFSPFSVSTVLAALSVGARGETHQQLFSGLGFNSSQLDQLDVNQAFSTLTESLASNKEISQGTAVFLDNLFKPKPDVLNVLKQSYLTESINVDFTKPAEGVNTINQYVFGKTGGKIPNLVEALDPSTVLYLLSYIYFKGTWKTQFDPTLTITDVFRVDEDLEVAVQMMRMEAAFDIYHDQALNVSVLRLPFTNSVSMLLLLPENMTMLEDIISHALVTSWLEGMKPRTYKISVPKFSVKTSYKLNSVLTEMGMVDVFGDRADLSGFAEGPLAVSEVVHQATLDIDEAGATAAAATGVGVVLYSALASPELKFNRPFGVIITGGAFKNLLFVGKIVNPNI